MSEKDIDSMRVWITQIISDREADLSVKKSTLTKQQTKCYTPVKIDDNVP